MGTQGAGRKRSTNKDKATAEDDALNLIAREAEARLAAKRAARAEAREIRMKELERQQKEIFQVQKKYYGLNPRQQQADSKWGDIEQWMEDSERFSRSSRLHTLSDDDDRMSVGSRGSVRSDLDSVGAYGGGGSSLHRKSKKKKKHKHRDRNGCHDDYSALSSRSSFTSSDLLDLSGSSRNPSLSFNGYQNLLYDDGLSLCSGSRRVSSSHPVASSYRSSRASSRASSARTSPVGNCGSVASFVRSAVSSSALCRQLEDITIPDFPEVEDRDFDKAPGSAPSLPADAALTAGGSIWDIKEIHELKDQIQDVEAKHQQNLKEAKEALVEAEDKYRKAMVSNAQLDNEKNNLMYQVDTLRDSLLELEELLAESRRQNQDKLQELERQKQAHSVLQFQFDELKETLKQSEELLNEIRQLRLQQDGLVREISELQETVEWKDKKIGALERQKDHSDAVRLERDELRQEAVRLRDALKKHGIVPGPDLSGDAAPPADGNGILGGTDELRACRDEDVAPEQQEETLEDVKQNQWSCDGQTPEAQSSEDPDGQTSGDPIDRPDPKAKAVIDVSRDLQQIQTSGETETCEVDSLSRPGLTATEAPGGDLSGGQGSKQEAVTTEPSARQAGLNSEPQQEPEEAENESQAQVSTASGKKKKRKKKTKKKGGTHENRDQQKAGTEKQNEKTRKDSGVQSNGLTAELETSRSTAGPQDNQEPEKVKDLDPSENVSTKENLQEPNTDPGSEGHNQEKHTNSKMSEGADVLGSTQAPRLGLEIVKDPQNKEDPEKPNEGSAGGILKESEVTGPDQEGNHITCKSKDGPDSSGDEATGDDASGLQQPTTDQVSGDEGKTGETLEQSDAVGSSCPFGAEQNQETSPTARDTAEPPQWFLQDEPLEESGPEAKMAEGEAGETNLASNEGDEGPKQHLPSCDQTAATPGFQEPDNDQVSGDQEEEAVESPEAPDEELVEVLQNQEETSEPEKHESVLQTTETSQTETLKGPNESETAEDVEEMESETGSDGGSNILTPGKREDPEEAIPPHGSSPEAAVVQNVLTKSGPMDGDQKMINNPESFSEEHDGGPESRAGPEINEETSASSSASSANDDARDQPETSNSPDDEGTQGPSMREPEEPDGGEPKVRTSGEPRGEPEDPGSPPKASAGRPEPEDGPNPEMVGPNPEMVGPNPEQVKELMEEPEGDDSPPHVQLDSNGDDREEDEGQSFDFDDSDVEAAAESALSSKLDLEDVEKGAEVNRKSSELWQRNTETKTDDGEETVSQDDDGTQNVLPCGDKTPEEAEDVPETMEQKTSPTAEDGLDPSDPHKSPGQTAREEPQGKDPKKKKGKGKSKEDCKMS